MVCKRQVRFSIAIEIDDANIAWGMSGRERRTLGFNKLSVPITEQDSHGPIPPVAYNNVGLAVQVDVSDTNIRWRFPDRDACVGSNGVI